MAKKDLQEQVIISARDNGISSVLFRKAIGRRLGLNVADMECLSMLQIKGDSTPTQLARFTGLTTGSTTALLDRLEKAKFIKRKPNPDDRRGLMIEVNKKTAELFGPLIAGTQRGLREIVASYTERELEIIKDFLNRTTANLNQQIEIIDGGSE